MYGLTPPASAAGAWAPSATETWDTTRNDQHHEPAHYVPHLDSTMYQSGWEQHHGHYDTYSAPQHPHHHHQHHLSAGPFAEAPAGPPVTAPIARASSTGVDHHRSTSSPSHFYDRHDVSRVSSTSVISHHSDPPWSDPSPLQDPHLAAARHSSPVSAHPLGAPYATSSSASYRTAAMSHPPPRPTASALASNPPHHVRVGSNSSTSAVSYDSDRLSSISPPVRGSDGTLSPPTTVRSDSSSDEAHEQEKAPASSLFDSSPSGLSAMAKNPTVNATAPGSSTLVAAESPKRSYPGAKRGRKPKPPPSPEEAKRNREICLEKNRIAALQSRRRKKIKNGQLENQANELMLRNKSLQIFARDLHVELMQLRALLARLPGGFPDVNAYLDREAQGGGIPTIMRIAGPTLEHSIIHSCSFPNTSSTYIVVFPSRPLLSTLWAVVNLIT
ncbi:BZ3500_MvSof-1268-A1-R1_Chr1-3g02190 [Microbotryum saponariae]|uniref:BZ3500_MvSof-1268-A1-R1_Chr1-3g02190 protein n=1 Tax=Microbotryum saponariae TaxID=289078 RepID=A0A2X0L9M0_9BASI|nr:BZ3500_MvSof-1268-A1-R1_Chr1-3g02190 [Microbotryum saponariae]SCZ95611.1 BZ3501_MvSof-1269-A2-R1_Chr1-3g01793 [Microbotryum saponariae]